jgi:hypothetical protein
MPLFTKTFDCLVWVMQMSNHFPRLHRQTLTRRLIDALLNFQELILKANSVRGAVRLERLSTADGQLNKVRLYLRLAHYLKWMNPGNCSPPPNLPQIGGGVVTIPSPIWGGLGWGG